MLILHALFVNGSFRIWGEHSFDKKMLLPAPELSGVRLIHPWCARVDELLEAKKLIGLKSPKRSQQGSETVYPVLPCRRGIPVPSSAVLGEVPEYGGEAVLHCFSVPAVSISFEEICSLYRVAKASGEKPIVPGLLMGEDLRYVCWALEYAALTVKRGAYMPDMEENLSGCYSVWTPLYLAKYQDELASLFTAVPPVLRSVTADGVTAKLKNGEHIADEIFCYLTDSMVRYALCTDSTRGKKVDSSNPHEVWLRSLIWKRVPLGNCTIAMASLYPQVRAWADSVRALTKRPWRLFIRLEEPLGEGKDKKWALTWHLQSSRDLSVIIPAARVWCPGPAEHAWFEAVGENPRKYMLRVLGQLAIQIPAVAKSLEAQYPSECLLSTDELFDFLQYHIPGILEQGIRIQFPSSWISVANRPKLALKGSVTRENSFSPGGSMSLNDLLDVKWAVVMGDDILTEEELALLTNLKTPLVNIRGKWMLLCQEEVESVISGLKKMPSKITGRDALIASFSKTLSGRHVSAITGSRWLDSVRMLLLEGDAEECEAPEGFCGTLRPYQRRGLRWLSRLASLSLGGCLADDMGLGKTVQSLAVIQKLRVEGETRPVLLIVPTSVIENWRREAKRFVPELAVSVHHGANRLKGDKFTAQAEKSAIVISSYSLLYRDAALFDRVRWAGVILDEAQNIKNPDAMQSKAACAVNADWHVALTGTPVENHVGDIWSIMEFILPGFMPNKTRFAREFVRSIQAGDKSAAAKVKKMTGPFILRRLKTDKNIISDLPEKIESTEFCYLGREQASLYSAVLTSMEKDITGSEGIVRRGIVLAALTGLKQICDHPALYLKDGSVLTGRSGKLERLTELADEMLSAGDKALIFTQYAEMGKLLKSYLQEIFGREVLFLHGSMPREKRDAMVRRFQEEKEAPPFFVLSLKAGGTGLNLTSANHVIMFDRWWNPAVEQQAVDRAYRIGQDRSVQVHYFCCKGTMEEKIEAIIDSKRQVAEAVVGSDVADICDMSDDDLRSLFALSRDAVEDIK